MESRYELRDKVGIGSEGVVYKAQNKETGEFVRVHYFFPPCLLRTRHFVCG